MHTFTWEHVDSRAKRLASGIRNAHIYGIPKGGIFAAQAVIRHIPKATLVENPSQATWFIDDIADSGATRNKYATMFPETPFGVLVDKEKEGLSLWISMPWERMNVSEKKQPETIEDNIRRILQYIGEDVRREGLLETPDRVVRSYAELFAGYKQDPADMFKVFEDGACDEMVLLKDIEMTSFCEHHMLPFTGRVHVAYIPNGKVIGVSKLARLVDVFARRLQIQERLTVQVTNALDQYLDPKGSACIISAKHQCMTCRGVGKQHSEMVTSSLTGVFKEEHSARQELLTLIYGGR